MLFVIGRIVLFSWRNAVDFLAKWPQVVSLEANKNVGFLESGDLSFTIGWGEKGSLNST